jgi:hypothetical protein
LASQRNQYPRGSLRVIVLLYALSAGRYGAAETHEENLLNIGTTNGKLHVRGSDAERSQRETRARKEAGEEAVTPPTQPSGKPDG